MITRKSFYNNIDIQYELIYQLQKRETMLIPYKKNEEGKMKAQIPVRWLSIQYRGMLEKQWKQFRFFEQNMNLYHSLATYENMPMFAWNWRIKSEQQKIWLKEFHKYLTRYDLFIETDSEEVYPAIEDAKKIKIFLDSYFVKYYMKFSLSGDTPIMIRQHCKIKIIEIKNAINYVKNSEVLTLSQDNQIVWRKILDFISHHDRLIEVYTKQSGNVPIKCTKDHSAFILDPETYKIKSKKGSDLKAGDYLITINSSEDIVQEKLEHIDFEYRFNRKIKSKNIKITNDLMWCLGAYLGDGSCSKYQLSLGKSDFGLVMRFGSFFENPYYRESKRTKGHKTLLYCQISSKMWRDFFDYSCGHLARHKHLPPFIWNLSKDKIYSFIEGYIDTDGQKTDKHFIKIKSKSKRIITELCWLLKLEGISCRINREVIKPHPNPEGKMIKGFVAWMISINREELIMILQKYSKEKNKFSPEPIDRCLPTKIFRNLLKNIKPKIMRDIYGNRKDSLIRNKETLSVDFLKEYLDWIEKNNKVQSQNIEDTIKNIKKILYSDVKITKINKIKKQKILSKVYDISVEDTERFYTGMYPLLWNNSGSKGIHFIIPHEEFSHLKVPLFDITGEKKSLVNIFKELAENIKLVLDLPTMDTSINDIKRVIKVAYSWDVKSGLIALPLTDDQFNNFNAEMVRPENVLKKGVHKRRLLWRNIDKPKHNRQLNIIRMLKDFEIALE